MLIITDTFDQVNGVSNTYKNLIRVSDEKIDVLHPSMFKSVSAPLYPEVQLVINPWRVYQAIRDIDPSHIHIATEGVMGLVARSYCKKHCITYTTSYHTKWPEFMKRIAWCPEFISKTFVRWFHKHSRCVLVPTPGMKEELENMGFKNDIKVWTRGVSSELITDKRTAQQDGQIRLLNVGRVSREKNLEKICELSKDSKYQVTIVGDGPYRAELEEKYPRVKFLGYKFGAELAKVYADNDVFVFPSLTDTFGIVMIEALCNGTPVAAYDVTGPKDVIRNGETGYLGDDLEENIRLCLSLDCSKIKKTSIKDWSWQTALDQFNDALTGTKK